LLSRDNYLIYYSTGQFKRGFKPLFSFSSPFPLRGRGTEGDGVNNHINLRDCHPSTTLRVNFLAMTVEFDFV